MNTQNLIDCDELNGFYANNQISEIRTKVERIVEDLKSKKIDIVDVIASLKDLLTNPDRTQRFNGVSFVTSIIKCFEEDHFFNDAQIKCLFEFYMDRMKDEVQVLEPVLDGLLSMVLYYRLDFEYVQRIFFSIHREVAVQLCNTKIKRILYFLIDNIFDLHGNKFAQNGAQVFYAFLAILDNETNSAVLERVFGLYEMLSKFEEFGLYREELFEACSGYFPILYSKEEDPKMLDIKKRIHTQLIRALTAHRDYIESAFALAFEKLESTSIYAKMSSYDLISNILKICRLEDFSIENMRALWTNIRIDSLKNSSDEDLKLTKKALKVLGEYAVWLQEELLVFNNSILHTMWADIKVALENASLKLIEPAVNIFQSIAKCDYFFEKYYVQAIGLVTKAFTESADINDKCYSLKALLGLVRRAGNSITDEEEQMAKETLSLIISQTISNSSSTMYGLACNIILQWSAIYKIDGIVPEVANFLDNCRRIPDFFTIIDSYMFIIEEYSFTRSFLFSKHFLYPLLDRLEEQVKSSEFSFDSEFELNVKVLLHASKKAEILICFKEFLLNILSKLNNREKVRYYGLIVAMFCEKYHFSEVEVDESFKIYYQLFSSKFASKLFEVLFKDIFENNLTFDSSFYLNLYFLLKIMIRYHTQYSSYHNFRNIIFLKNISVLCFEDDKFEELSLEKLNCLNLEMYLYISNAYLSSRDIWFNYGIKNFEFSQVVECLLDDLKNLLNSETIHSKIICSLYSKNLCLAILRCEDNNVYQEQIEKVSKFIDNQLGENYPVLRTQLLITLFMLSYETNDPSTEKLFDSVLDSFTDETYNEEFSTCLTNSNYWYNLVNACFRDPLQHLEYFNHRSILISGKFDEDDVFSKKISNKILEKFNQTKSNVLLSLLIEYFKYRSSDIFKIENSTLLTDYLAIILQGFKIFVNDPRSIKNCFDFLNCRPEINDKLLPVHIIRICKACVECATESNNFRVRREALLLLERIVKEHKNNSELIAIKQQLACDIRPILSDPKRLVRTVASNLNVRICMLGQPGN